MRAGGAPPALTVEPLPKEFAAYRSLYTLDARFDYAASYDNVMLFGSPDHIAERVGQLRDTGAENLIFFVNFGGIEHQKVLDHWSCSPPKSCRSSPIAER